MLLQLNAQILQLNMEILQLTYSKFQLTNSPRKNPQKPPSISFWGLHFLLVTHEVVLIQHRPLHR